jgi:hypothetical protein
MSEPKEPMTAERALEWLDGMMQYVGTEATDVEPLDFIRSALTPPDDDETFKDRETISGGEIDDRRAEMVDLIQAYEPVTDDAEQRVLLADLEEAWGTRHDGKRYFLPSYNRIRALISAPPAPKPRVTFKKTDLRANNYIIKWPPNHQILLDKTEGHIFLCRLRSIGVEVEDGKA